MAATETSARANEVLDELYREHVGDVYRYTYAVLGNHADAEDVTQTTFVNALRALERGETPEEPSHWLTVIAHNLVRQRWRQAASRPALVELETDVAEAEEDEEEFELEELVRALQRIPETQREAIVMRELEGRSYREIATVMGLSTSALETLLFRARRSLAEELENVVTCENAELALSKRLDGRLSRKDRRRLDEHLAECPDCARLAAAQKRQRKAFKGLALLPLPIGLALFKGAPSAAAATSLPTIGLGTAGAGTSGTGAAGAGAGAAGGAAVGGSLAGGLAVKVAAIVVTATVAAGVGYKGVEAVRDTPDKTPPAKAEKAPVKKAAPGVAVARHSTRGEVGKPKAGAKAHGKPVSSPGRAKHGMAPQPGLAKSQSAKIAGQPNSTHAASPASGTHGKAQAPGQVAPKHFTAPAHPKKAAPASVSKAPKGANETQAPSGGPVTPKTPKNPVSGGSSGNPNGGAGGNPSNGSTSAPPTGSAAPTGGAPTGTTSPPPAGSTTVTPPQTQQPVPPASTPPTTTPPVTTPPVTTPPASDPASGGTTTPPGDTTGDTSGSDDSSNPGNNGVDGSEQGKKLGHHKGNHDGKHPEDS
jgi:RNA polymerase sigma factor (sigma-70 family)